MECLLEILAGMIPNSFYYNEHQSQRLWKHAVKWLCLYTDQRWQLLASYLALLFELVFVNHVCYLHVFDASEAIVSIALFIAFFFCITIGSMFYSYIISLNEKL